jgi:hypothetical protein
MNNITRFNAPPPPVGTQSGQWVWNGTSWVCDSDDFFPPQGQPPFCPPPSFPPAGCPPWFPPPQGQPPWYPGANAGVSFGSTAPVNPVRGHFWWDGKNLNMFDGAAWVIVGGAGGSGVTPPMTVAPANPVPGQQWFDGTTLRVWDGNAWIPVSQTKTFIQATAPSGPNPGDTWWDGTQFRIWNGSAWELVGPGATVGPVATTTIVFAMSNPSGLAGPGSNAWGIIPFSATPQTDLLAGWDPVGHKYTPTKQGLYSCMLRGYASGSTGAGRAILKNDPSTFTGGGLGSDTVVGIASESIGGWLTATGLVPLNGSTDYVRAWGWDGGGSFPSGGSNAVWVVTLLP